MEIVEVKDLVLKIVQELYQESLKNRANEADKTNNEEKK